MKFIFRNPVTKARLVLDTKEAADRLEKALPNMWVRATA